MLIIMHESIIKLWIKPARDSLSSSNNWCKLLFAICAVIYELSCLTNQGSTDGSHQFQFTETSRIDASVFGYFGKFISITSQATTWTNWNSSYSPMNHARELSPFIKNSWCDIGRTYDFSRFFFLHSTHTSGSLCIQTGELEKRPSPKRWKKNRRNFLALSSLLNLLSLGPRATREGRAMTSRA